MVRAFPFLELKNNTVVVKSSQVIIYLILGQGDRKTGRQGTRQAGRQALSFCLSLEEFICFTLKDRFDFYFCSTVFVKSNQIKSNQIGLELKQINSSKRSFHVILVSLLYLVLSLFPPRLKTGRYETRRDEEREGINQIKSKSNLLLHPSPPENVKSELKVPLARSHSHDYDFIIPLIYFTLSIKLDSRERERERGSFLLQFHAPSSSLCAEPKRTEPNINFTQLYTTTKQIKYYTIRYVPTVCCIGANAEADANRVNSNAITDFMVD